MRFAAVLFDVGNTLIHLDYSRMAVAASEAAGRAVAPADLESASYGARAAVEAAMAAGAVSDGQRHRVFMRALFEDLGLEPAAVGNALERVRAAHREVSLYSVVRPGTLATLERLRAMGVVVGAVSNADGTVESLLQAAGLMGPLSFVVDSGRVGVEKPDRRIFQMGLDQAGVAAADALYVGDVYAIDVVGARGAGMEALLLDPLGRYQQLDCRTAPDVTAVPELVSTNREG